MYRFLAALGATALLFAAAASARADDDKDLKDLVAKAIKAHGGADNLAKVKATVTKGKGKFYGMGDDGIDYTGTWTFQAPDRMRVDISGDVGGQTFKFVQVIDKDKAWQQIMDDVQDSDKAQLKEGQEELHAYRLAMLMGLGDKDCKLSATGEMKVEDRPAVGIRVECKGHGDVTLYFDKETSRLVMLERRAKDVMADKDFTSQTVFKDHKKVDGILVPYKHTIKRDGKLYVEHEVTDWTAKDKIEESVFKKPV
jgi:hypothetical protein